MWAGASGDYYPIHYDKDFAQSRGLPGVIVHGQLVASFLGQLITDGMGEQGSRRKLTCSYRGFNLPGDTLGCKWKISKKYIEDGEHYVVCSIWAENLKGEKTVSGVATVILPARGWVELPGVLSAFLPLFTVYLHKHKAKSIPNHMPIWGEAAFFEAFLRSVVPV